jgi:hypothetical protein
MAGGSRVRAVARSARDNAAGGGGDRSHSAPRSRISGQFLALNLCPSPGVRSGGTFAFFQICRKGDGSNRRGARGSFVDLALCYPKRAVGATVVTHWSATRRTSVRRYGGLCHVVHDGDFEAKASEEGCPSVGCRRDVFVGGRRIRHNRRSGNGYTVAGHTASPNRTR